MIFSLDTSALITAWETYPMSNFEPLWVGLGELIDAGSIVASEQVREELAERDDEVREWTKHQQKLFVPLEREIQRRVKFLLQEYPLLRGKTGKRNHADPWVIALAEEREGVVVTQEKPRALSDRVKMEKIPDVCADRQTRCITFPALLVELGWRFRLE